MKKLGGIFLFAVLIWAAGATGDPKTAHAAIDRTDTVVTLTEVTDIDVYSNYNVNEVSIDTMSSTNGSDGTVIYKFNLPEDGFIKLGINAIDLKKTILKLGSTNSTETVPASLTATVYRDPKLMYAVVPTLTWKISPSGSTITESSKIALDVGTYYVVFKTDPYSVVSSSKQTTTTYVKGKAGFILYYQRVESDEMYRPSSVGLENKVGFDTVYKSFLTVPNPKDYYSFVLEDKALVKINFMYASTKSFKFTLYGVDREELVTKVFTGNNVWYNIEKYLEPGKYYCSLETTVLNDGGKASLQINQTVYPLILSQKNQKTNSYIAVSTIDQPVEIRWVKGKLTNSELNSSKWKSGKIITDSKMFGVNMTGDYTVRVTDEYGNMFMQSIRVTNCDTKAPSKPIIKTYAADTLVVTGTAEKNSLVTVSVNGVLNTCTASSKGNFNCTLKRKLMKGDIIEVSAQDISGNISTKAEVIVK